MTTKQFLSRLLLVPSQYGYPTVFYDDPKKDYYVMHNRLPYEELQRVFFSPTPSYGDVRKVVGIILREGMETNMICGAYQRPIAYFRQPRKIMSENIK